MYAPTYLQKGQWDNGARLYTAANRPLIAAGYGREKIIKTGHVIQQNPGAYAATLLDPFNHKGVRIPDLSCYPTTTFTLETSFTWNVINTAGTANRKAIVVDLNRDPQWQYMEGKSSTTPGARISGSAKTLGTNVSTNYKSSRLVSAGVVVKFAGNDSASAGTISVVNYPGFDAIGVTINKTTSYVNEINNPETTVNFYLGPAREGCAAYYRPVDTSCFEIGPIGQTDCFGAFIISTDGVADNTPFTVEITTNWEGIPNGNTIGFDMLSTTMDVGAFQLGLEAGGMGVDVCDANESTKRSIETTAQEFMSPPRLKDRVRQGGSLSEQRYPKYFKTD